MKAPRKNRRARQGDLAELAPGFDSDPRALRRADALRYVVVDALVRKYGSVEDAANALDSIYGDEGRPVSGSMLRAAARNAERNYFRLEWIVPVLGDPAVQMALSGKRFTPEERERLMREHFAKHAGGELERFDRQLAAMGEVLDG